MTSRFPWSGLLFAAALALMALGVVRVREAVGL